MSLRWILVGVVGVAEVAVADALVAVVAARLLSREVRVVVVRVVS